LINSQPKIILIGGSAGSFQLLSRITSSIPSNFPHVIIIVSHRVKNIKKGFSEALGINSNLSVIEPEHNTPIKPGMIYVAPANYHLGTHSSNFELSTEPPIHNSRPSIDYTFQSFAHTYDNKTIGILLSGANTDGAHGLNLIKQKGGKTIVQSPEYSEFHTMPESAITLNAQNFIWEPEQIIEFLKELS